MSYTVGGGAGTGESPASEVAAGRAGEKLSLGVAARLSRYLQVLTQARKMGKQTISSQELAEFTHVNSTQIRRDLSGFGKFGKRGVGYNVESLLAEIRRILHTSGQHNIALFGAGHLGTAIATSDIFRDHGFRVVAIFDRDEAKVGQRIGALTVRHTRELREAIRAEQIVVAVLAVPAAAAQELADELVQAGVRIIFNYSDALLHVPPEVTVHTSNPAVDLLYALYVYVAWAGGGDDADHRTCARDLRRERGLHRRARGGVRAARPRAARPGAALRRALHRRPARPAACRLGLRRADRLGDRASLGPLRELCRGARRPARAPASAVRARIRARCRARLDRDPPVVGLPRAGDHRHRPLPPRGGRAQVRRLAQQHLLAARSRRHPRRGPGGAGVRPPAPGPADPARDLRQLAVPGRTGLRSAQRAHADVHAQLPALRDPRCVWLLERVRAVRRVPRAHPLDRRVHPGVVVGAAALRLRHGRGADLRCSDHRRRVGGAGGTDRRLRGASGARARRGPAPSRPAPQADRGEPLARGAAWSRRRADRSRAG